MFQIFFSFYHFLKIVHEKGLNFLAIQICDTIFENQGAMDTNRRQVLCHHISFLSLLFTKLQTKYGTCNNFVDFIWVNFFFIKLDVHFKQRHMSFV